jgi:uncharacterized membrane protein YhaH (DUF805 family)
MPLKDLLFSFQGRIRRSQWWAVHLSVLGLMIVLALVVGGISSVIGQSDTGKAIGVSLLGLAILVALPVTVWVSLATGVKRLHDQGLSGWMVLISFVPYIGGLFSVICMGCLDGKPGRNEYGPSPKYPESEAEAFS